MGDYLALAMLPALLLALFLGFPVAFSMMGVALIFGIATFGEPVIFQFVQKVDAMATAFELAAVPLFIFMGAMMERSGIAEQLFEAIHLWTRRLPGGLAVGTVLMCVVFAASSGVIGATETVVGMLAIPVMLKYAYDKGLISGTICAGGSLGAMIPPSIVFVVYATQAQLSIGHLFAGAIIPSIAMVGLFLGYTLVRCYLHPQAGPPIAAEELDVPMKEKLRITATSLLPAFAIVVTVVGSILAGIASPTEAAGVGALGTILLTLSYGKLDLAVLKEAGRATLVITSMVMFIVVGGTMFTSIFQMNGGRQLIQSVISTMDLSPTQLIFVILFILLILGFILDWISVVLICVPIYDPLLRAAGIDPIWFAVMAIVAIQTSYLTPPMAPTIFYLRSIAPPDITYRDMYVGVAPFVLCQIGVLFMIFFMPSTVLWLTTFVGF